MSGVGHLVLSGPLLFAVPVAAAAGAVTFLSPCVLPLVPGYLSYVTGMSGIDAQQSAADPAADGAADGGPGADEAGSGGAPGGPARRGAGSSHGSGAPPGACPSLGTARPAARGSAGSP